MKPLVGLLVLTLLAACGADGEPLPTEDGKLRLTLSPSGKPILGVTRRF